MSLAVWIGGAIRELDRLQRPDPFVTAVLDATVFSRAEVDILTGASAGGLNAAIGGFAIANGRPVDLRKVWIRVADIDRLLASDRRELRSSVLDGNFFLDQVIRQIRRIGTSTPSSEAAAEASDEVADDHCPRLQPVEMFLASTVFGGLRVAQRVDPLYSDRRREAYFHFRHLAGAGSFSDLRMNDAVDQIGTAARATASFPAAFEPVEIGTGAYWGRLHLPEASDPPGTLRMLDGGIVDNIPVTRAIQAAAAAPARDPVRRWVVFLHPSPEGFVTRPDPPFRGFAPGIPAVLKDVLSSLSAETLLDDLAVLERHNRESDAQKLQRNSLFADALRRSPNDADASLASVDAYRIYALLEDPASNLAWIPIGDMAPPSPLAHDDDDARFALRWRIAREVLDHVSQGGSTLRPFARIVRLAHFVIEWIRWAEQHGATFPAQRRLTYDILQASQLIDAALSIAPIARPRDPVRALAHALAEAEGSRSIHALLRDIADRRENDPCNWEQPLAEYLSPESPSGCVLSSLARWSLPEDRSDGGGSASAMLLDLLAATGAEVVKATTGVDPEQESAFTLLAASIGAPWARKALAATSVGRAVLRRKVRGALLTIDAAGAGIHRGFARGTPQRLEYIRISGAASSPLCHPSSALDALPSFREITGPGGTIHPDRKLAGNKLGSFSAFLSPRFRANDWMWGRMDAATEIVNLLFRPDYLTDASVPELVCRIRAIIHHPFTHQPDGSNADDVTAAEAICADLWRGYEAAIRRELSMARSAPRGADVLEFTRYVIQARWHLELAIEEIPAVLSERLDRNDRATNWPVASPVRPGEPAETPKERIQRLLTLYEETPRTVSALWGRRDTTGLGVRAVRAATRALTPTRGIRTVPGRIAIGVPLLIVVAAVLSRGAFLIAWNALVNIVLLPRLEETALFVVGGTSAVASAVFWFKLVRRARTRDPRGSPRRTPLVREGLTAVVTLGLIAVGLTSSLHPWLQQPTRMYESVVPWRGIDWTTELVVPAAAVALATAIATACLWNWARGGAVVTAAIGTALVMGWWVVMGAWCRVGESAVAWILQGIRSMWVPTAFFVVFFTWLALSFRIEARATPEDLE